MTQALYRFYDAGGSLLYVGVTLDPPLRFRSHMGSKDWWDQVREIRLEHFPDRASVLVAEREAIHRERPRYNVKHNTSVASSGQIVWSCETCGKPIGRKKGYIRISWQDISDYEDQLALWERRYERNGAFSPLSIAALMERPSPAHWSSFHDACDPQFNASGYYIDVESWTAPAQGFDWVAHLIDKQWIDSTDFPSLLQAVSDTLACRGKRRA